MCHFNFSPFTFALTSDHKKDAYTLHYMLIKTINAHNNVPCWTKIPLKGNPMLSSIFDGAMQREPWLEEGIL